MLPPLQGWRTNFNDVRATLDDIIKEPKQRANLKFMFQMTCGAASRIDFGVDGQRPDQLRVTWNQADWFEYPAGIDSDPSNPVAYPIGTDISQANW